MLAQGAEPAELVEPAFLAAGADRNVRATGSSHTKCAVGSCRKLQPNPKFMRLRWTPYDNYPSGLGITCWRERTGMSAPPVPCGRHCEQSRAASVERAQRGAYRTWQWMLRLWVEPQRGLRRRLGDALSTGISTGSALVPGGEQRHGAETQEGAEEGRRVGEAMAGEERGVVRLGTHTQSHSASARLWQRGARTIRAENDHVGHSGWELAQLRNERVAQPCWGNHPTQPPHLDVDRQMAFIGGREVGSARLAGGIHLVSQRAAVTGQEPMRDD